MSRTEGRRGRRQRNGLPRCNLGRLLDLSESGARVRCGRRRAPAPGAGVRLSLEGPAGRSERPARVVWRRVTGLWTAEVGLRFLDPAEGMAGSGGSGRRAA